MDFQVEYLLHTKEVASQIVTRVLACRPRNFTLRKIIPRELDYRKNLYFKLSPELNDEIEKNDIREEQSIDLSDDGDYDYYLDTIITIKQNSRIVKSRNNYFIPLNCCTCTIFVEEPDESKFGSRRYSRYYHCKNKALNEQLFDWALVDIKEGNDVQRSLNKILEKLFGNQTLYIKEYDVFQSAIFSGQKIAGQALICQETVVFRTLGGDVFETGVFAINYDENPFDAAMDEAARVMEIPKEEFYFVNQGDPIVLYHPTDSE